MKANTRWAAVLVFSALAGSAQATFTDLGDGTVLDTTTSLIWLKNWNTNGLQDWATQKAWAQDLTFAGSSDWVLPSFDQFVSLQGSGYNYFIQLPWVVNMPSAWWTANESVAGVSAFFQVPGNQSGIAAESTLLGATAVRSANAVAVPEPQSLALVLLALGGAALATRRRGA